MRGEMEREGRKDGPLGNDGEAEEKEGSQRPDPVNPDRVVLTREEDKPWEGPKCDLWPARRLPSHSHDASRREKRNDDLRRGKKNDDLRRGKRNDDLRRKKRNDDLKRGKRNDDLRRKKQKGGAV